MKKENTCPFVFSVLLRAGLWGDGVQLTPYEPVDFEELYELAEEQSSVGLVAAGLEKVEDRKIIKKEALPFLKRVYSVEKRNEAMNMFIGNVITKMRIAGIYAILVKGQGVAQCYERPLWRSSGDIDLFFDEDNYQRAKVYLTPLASHIDEEDTSRLHLGMIVDSWTLELHGTMRTKISSKVDRVIDEVQRDIFQNGSVRVWRNGDVDIFLPNPNNDTIIVFTHFIHHFYVGGIGLRQISDWCRLLWVYRDTLDQALLKGRLQRMGLMNEWKAFAALAVEVLGMPDNAMPFYSDAEHYRKKAMRIFDLVLEAGNLGHNKDSSYRTRYSIPIICFITFVRRLGEFLRISTIFPGNARRFFVKYVFHRASSRAFQNM